MIDEKKYLERGGICCPFCGSTAVAGGHIVAQHTNAWAEVECEDCGAQWRDVYSMTGYEIIRGRERHG